MYEHADIVTILENAGLGTSGTDIFAYHSPPEAKNCIIIYPSNDPPQIDFERPSYYRAKFQIIVRNSDYLAGLEVCKQVQEALTIMMQTDTPNMRIKQCRPLWQARIYRRSGSGDLEMSINFQIIYVAKSPNDNLDVTTHFVGKLLNGTSTLTGNATIIASGGTVDGMMDFSDSNQSGLITVIEDI